MAHSPPAIPVAMARPITLAHAPALHATWAPPIRWHSLPRAASAQHSAPRGSVPGAANTWQEAVDVQNEEPGWRKGQGNCVRRHSPRVSQHTQMHNRLATGCGTPSRQRRSRQRRSCTATAAKAGVTKRAIQSTHGHADLRDTGTWHHRLGTGRQRQTCTCSWGLWEGKARRGPYSKWYWRCTRHCTRICLRKQHHKVPARS